MDQSNKNSHQNEGKSKDETNETDNNSQWEQQKSDPHDDPPLSAEFRRRIRPILNRIDELRACGLQKELQLPMVAVVGDQSVGKSSVLEAISGIELPRGTGIVTRCPLQLSMRCLPPNSDWRGTISYKTLDGDSINKQLHDPAEIDAAVREAQKLMTTSDGDITDEQISLTIESSSVPDLTLLDLPGIARYSSTSGSSINKKTKSLISKYVNQPQVLILAVVPCHVDIETVEAVSLAKAADPKGERTVGVMTCPDMVNKGAEADVMKIALNQKIQLLKGYVMVKCRNPEQLKEKVTLAECQQLEQQFFNEHPHFNQLPESCRGIRRLALKLSEELFLSVKRNIPHLQQEMSELRMKYQKELSQIGMNSPESPKEKIRLLNEMVNQFSSELKIATKGEMNSQFELFSRLRSLWERLGQEIEHAKPSWIVSPSFSNSGNVLSHSDLDQLVSKFRGREPPSYDYIFPIIERKFRDKFLSDVKDQAERFLEACADVVQKVIKSIAESSFQNFYDLIEVVIDKTSVEMESIIDEARSDLDRLFKQESRVFTQDKLFLLKMSQIEKDLAEKARQYHVQLQKPDSKERIRRGLDAYLQIASERLADTIPQSVLYYMLNITADRICNRMADLTVCAEEFLGLISEDAGRTMRRQHLKESLEQMRLAQKEFNSFRASMPRLRRENETGKKPKHG